MQSNGALALGATFKRHQFVIRISQVQSATLLVIDGQLRGVFQFAHKAAVHGSRFDGESRDCGGLIDFSARGEHTRACPACLTARGALIKNRYEVSGLRETPSY
jgi:hypothetical protein